MYTDKGRVKLNVFIFYDFMCSYTPVQDNTDSVPNGSDPKHCICVRQCSDSA